MIGRWASDYLQTMKSDGSAVFTTPLSTVLGYPVHDRKDITRTMSDNDLYCDSRLIELAAKILAGAYKRDPVWAISTLNLCLDDRDKCLELFASAKLNEHANP